MENEKEDEIKNEQSTSTTQHEQIEEIKSEFNLQLVSLTILLYES